MGIANLLKVFARFCRKSSVQQLVESGFDSCVVDFSSWLHGSKYGAAVLCFENRRTEAVNKIWPIFRKRLDILKKQGIKRVMFVRDGAPVLAKEPTDMKRREKREAARKEAQVLRQTLSSLHTEDEANKYATKCTEAFSRELWLEQMICAKIDDYSGDNMEVRWMVALGEADPQILHLLQCKLYHFGIVDDQDYLA